jgi:hypothetical protein
MAGQRAAHAFLVNKSTMGGIALPDDEKD